MKILGLVALFFAATSFGGMKSFPNGTYEGMGYWKSPEGQKGEYTAVLKVEDGVVYSKIDLGDGEVHEEKGMVKFNDHGFFSFHMEGKDKPVSMGYCGSVWCHSNGKDENGVFEETIVFVDGLVYRLGAMKHKEHGVFMWEDELKPVKK